MATREFQHRTRVPKERWPGKAHSYSHNETGNCKQPRVLFVSAAVAQKKQGLLVSFGKPRLVWYLFTNPPSPLIILYFQVIHLQKVPNKENSNNKRKGIVLSQNHPISVQLFIGRKKKAYQININQSFSYILNISSSSTLIKMGNFICRFCPRDPFWYFKFQL